MKKRIIVLSLLLAGCSQGYTEEDVQNAYEKGHQEGYDKGKEAGYNRGLAYGMAEMQSHYKAKEEKHKEQLDSIASKLEDIKETEDRRSGYSGQATTLTSGATPSVDTNNKPLVPMNDPHKMNGFNWTVKLEFQKIDILQSLAEEQGIKLSRDEAKALSYLIDDFYETKALNKSKTVKEALLEVQFKGLE